VQRNGKGRNKKEQQKIKEVSGLKDHLLRVVKPFGYFLLPFVQCFYLDGEYIAVFTRYRIFIWSSQDD